MKSPLVSLALAGLLLLEPTAALASGHPGHLSPSEAHDAAYWVESGTALYAVGQLPGAVRAYRNAVEADPSRADSRYNLAVALEAQGRMAEAELSYRKALVLAPVLAEANVGLAGLLARAGDLEGARESLREALKSRPHDPSIHHQFGLLHLAQGQPAFAADSFGKALQLNPRFEAARLGLGQALEASGKAAEGRRCSSQARAELSPEALHEFNAELAAWTPREAPALELAANPVPTAKVPRATVIVAKSPAVATARTAKPSAHRTVVASGQPELPARAGGPGFENPGFKIGLAGAAREVPRSGTGFRRSADQPRLTETIGCMSVAAAPSRPAPARPASSVCPLPTSPAIAGLSQLSRGNDRAALELLSAAVEAAPSDAASVNNLACAQARLGYTDLARALYDLASLDDSVAGRAAAANRRLLTEMMAGRRTPSVTVQGGLAVLK